MLQQKLSGLFVREIKDRWWMGSGTSSALLPRRMNLPSRSTSSTVMRPLAEACWLRRVLVTAPPAMLDVSLSLSLRRRFLELAAPEELRLLEAVVADWSRRLVWLWLEPEVRATETLMVGGLGDRRSLGTDGGRGLEHRYRRGHLFWSVPRFTPVIQTKR